ncbi:hypothetical protein CTheo_8146 [Ceratobasidium theobromae]|uniref:Uncharacterized protein n=1 Tax=Ceratobasidium theobromae TaxID=1582974 RepID=A0A5N5Q9V6_9AGAM|nr:hypothetical protein CTheo_8146 [Ceratobasidium theobromae]
MNTKLQVIHFNDVYQLTRPKLKADKENENKLVPDMKVIDPKGNISDTSSHIILFYEKIKSIRDKWEENSSNEPEGLVLFSGDLFSPSVESSVTCGSNMVHLMNEIVPDVAVPGKCYALV